MDSPRSALSQTLFLTLLLALSPAMPLLPSSPPAVLAAEGAEAREEGGGTAAREYGEGKAAREDGEDDEDVFKVQGGASVVRPPPPSRRPIPFLSGKYSPGARTVIPREKFKDTQKSVADVLEEVPGLTVTRQGDDLAPTRVTIRGSRAHQVLILVDGVRVNPAENDPSGRRNEGRSGFDLSAIPLDKVASIEVIRGAASGLYGPGAAAGVIHIRTRRPRRPSLEGTVTWGSLGLWETGWYWDTPQGTPAGQRALGLRFNFRKSDGEYVYYDPDAAGGTGTTPSEAEQCAVPLGGGYFQRRCNKKTIATLGMEWRQGEHRRIGWEFGYLLREGLGGVQDARPHGRETQRRLRLAYDDGVTFTGEDGGGGQDRGAGGGVGAETAPTAEKTAPAADAERDEPMTLGWRVHLERLSTERIENTTLPAGERTGYVDTRLDSAKTWEFWRGPHRFRLGTGLVRQVIAEDEFTVARNTFSLFSAWNLGREEGAWEGALRLDKITSLPARPSGRLALSEALWGGLGVKLSLGSGYRPPSLYELHDPGAFSSSLSMANPELQPETSTSRDGGLFWEPGEHVYAELLAFHQDTRNQIIAYPEGSRLYFRNLAHTRSRGVEAALNLRLPGRVAVDLNYTRTDAIVLEAVDPALRGNRVPGVPERQWKAALSWRPGRWRLWTLARHSGTRYVDDSNSRFLRPYTVWDGGLTLPLTRAFSLSVEGRNLTNITYAEVDNHPPAGRRALVTLRWNPPAKPSRAPGDQPRSR